MRHLIIVTAMLLKLLGGDSYSLQPSPMRLRLCPDGFFSVRASKRGIEANSKSSADKTATVGGVYQYSGPTSRSSDPPAELAALLGMKHKKSSFKSSRAQPAKTTARPAGTGKVEESIDLLERQVLSKYRSSSFKIGAEDEWDDEDLEELRGPTNRQTGKFHGFQPSRELYTASKEDSSDDGAGSYVDDQHIDRSREGDAADTSNKVGSPSKQQLSQRILERRAPAVAASSSIAPVSVAGYARSADIDYDPSDRGEQEDSWDEEDLQFLFAGPAAKTAAAKRSAERVPAPTYRQESLPTSSTSAKARVDPQTAVSTFRLRPPTPVDPAVLAKLESKAAAIAEKEQSKKLRREQLLSESKSQFTPFEFQEEAAAVPPAGSPSTQSTSADGGILTGASFRDLGIKDEAILRNLDRLRLYSPTRIQALAIPALLSGRPAVLQAQTGSGKTLAFLLPLLEAVDPARKQVQALILAPSRELVTQIAHVAESVFRDSGYRVVSLIGGANVRNQIKHLREDRPQIVVATPGRLAELVFRLEKIKLGMVCAVVIDEVDNMMQDPYVGEIETILQATPLFSAVSQGPSSRAFGPGSSSELSPEESDDDDDDAFDSSLPGDDDINRAVDDSSDRKRQQLICLASATSNDPSVASFADRYCGEKMWSRIAVDSGAMLPATITHGLISTTRMRALDMLRRFLNAKPAVRSAIIFVNDPHRVEVVVRELHEMGLIAAPLHGDSSKEDRKEIIARLKDGRLRLVVATELAARGLDIPDLSHVINFELPTDAQHYVHRTGRCGRAGKQGLAMNFANPDTKFVIRRFGKKLGIKVHDCEIRDGRVFLKMR